jgi:hypothetical protein
MSWYRFERHGRAEVTVFDLGGVRARTGAKGTRRFRQELAAGEAPARRLVDEALRRMPEVRRRWPWKDWPRPAGYDPAEEHEIVLPAFLLAAGESVESVDGVVRTGGRGY